ncbi:MAG TPA: DedA family protein [Longimicrobiales bacterium]|nr:DedA family protein [Longimicrobiales bacterium]
MLGLGGALENLVPPIPADTVVLFGGFLSARGQANPWLVWLVVLVANVGSALFVYAIARRYGEQAFRTRVGQWILQPEQLRKVASFYRRWGVFAIFFSRFLPAFRAVVPVFAGVSEVPLPRVAVPMVAASGLWYGLLVYLGHSAGANWQRILDLFDRFNHLLLGIAVGLAALVVFWWWRSRRTKR